jgi:hypothetical protein
MSRSLVSYDDLAPTPSQEQTHVSNSQQQHKKRKWGHQHAKRGPHAQQRPQHWDDPSVSYPSPGVVQTTPLQPLSAKQDGSDDFLQPAARAVTNEKSQQRRERWEDERELTHEEVWDDSALIDAWNAAQEEYEVC